MTGGDDHDYDDSDATATLQVDVTDVRGFPDTIAADLDRASLAERLRWRVTGVPVDEYDAEE